MNNDFKSLDELIQKYNYNYKTKPLVEELIKIKSNWEEQKLYIDTEIEWDELHDAELNFSTLREENKNYINELLVNYSSDDDCDDDCDDGNGGDEDNNCVDGDDDNDCNDTDTDARTDEAKIKLSRPKKIYGDLPGQKKRGKYRTSQELGGTTSVKEEKAYTEFCNLHEVVDYTIKLLRDIHQNPDYIKWKGDTFTTSIQHHKTLTSLPKLMKTHLFNISNKKRIELLLNYKQTISSKHYTVIKIMFKSKTNFSIDLIEALYNQLVYIIHTNLYSYDVDKLIALFDLLIKNNAHKIIDYISSKTLDSDNYCIKL